MDERRSVLCGKKHQRPERISYLFEVTQLQVRALQLAEVLIKTNSYLIDLTRL